ncbi:MAG: DUF4340 domain-containing protein [Chloroflexi bacterium]|nr:DUF4340 domain-containing protein [Chloroflexota bacterium]
MARKATSKTSSQKKSPAIVPAPSTPKKPAFRAGTLIAVLLLLALSLFVIYLNREKKNKEAEATPAGEVTTFVFNESDGIVNSIEISPALGETVKVARDEKNIWVLKLPIKAEADQGWSEAAASQISALLVTSPIPADADPSIFGFDSPKFIITIVFADGKTHTLEVGDTTPSQNGYYVRLDKSKMMIVDLNGIDSLTQLASFPPYLNTPTPSPLPPTETPVSPTDGAPTPEISVTPAP